MKKIVWALGFVALLPSCSPQNGVATREQAAATDTALIDLLESTHIIREMIRTDRIGDLLENHDEEQLEVLLNNMSPAHMAVEVEMMRTPMPVIAYFFEPGIRHDHALLILKDMAKTYDEKVKCVMIEGPKLFELYDAFAITTLPTVLLLKHGEVVARLEDTVDRERLEQEVMAKFAV